MKYEYMYTRLAVQVPHQVAACVADVGNRLGKNTAITTDTSLIAVCEAFKMHFFVLHKNQNKAYNVAKKYMNVKRILFRLRLDFWVLPISRNSCICVSRSMLVQTTKLMKIVHVKDVFWQTFCNQNTCN